MFSLWTRPVRQKEEAWRTQRWTKEISRFRRPERTKMVELKSMRAKQRESCDYDLISFSASTFFAFDLIGFVCSRWIFRSASWESKQRNSIGKFHQQTAVLDCLSRKIHSGIVSFLSEGKKRKSRWKLNFLHDKWQNRLRIINLAKLTRLAWRLLSAAI